MIYDSKVGRVGETRIRLRIEVGMKGGILIVISEIIVQEVGGAERAWGRH